MSDTNDVGKQKDPLLTKKNLFEIQKLTRVSLYVPGRPGQEFLVSGSSLQSWVARIVGFFRKAKTGYGERH